MRRPSWLGPPVKRLLATNKGMLLPKIVCRGASENVSSQHWIPFTGTPVTCTATAGVPSCPHKFVSGKGG